MAIPPRTFLFRLMSSAVTLSVAVGLSISSPDARGTGLGRRFDAEGELVVAASQQRRRAPVDQAEVLGAHNRWRAQVGARPLNYSSALAAEAQTWAEHLRDRNRCRMRHSEVRDQGENLYWASPIEWSDGARELQRVGPRDVVDAWASERVDYDARANRCGRGKVCGHYTQIVWKRTTTVGCGMAICDQTREQVWVCRYQPPGNWVGERPF